MATNAWSHPHSSAILVDTWLQTAYATSGWGDEGSPIVPISLEFNGTTTSVDCGSAADIDDLHDAAFTAEAWIRADSAGESSVGRILDKAGDGTTGWYLGLTSTGLYAIVNCATTDATVSYTTGIIKDSRQHHVAITWDDAGDRKINLWLDGVLVGTSGAGVGAIVSDAANSLFVGNNAAGSATFDGGIGWGRLSNSVRYTATFVAPSRLNPPAVDGNALRQFNFRDGTGTQLTDSGATAAHGTIANGTWNIVADQSTDCPGQRVFPFGYVHGVDAANEGIVQTIAGLTAGANYVARVPVNYERDRQAWPVVVIYDATNGAAISTFSGPRLVDVHTGANDSATLINANGHFPQSLVGGKLYNITDASSTTITAISGDFTTCTGVLAGGTDNNWDTNDVYMLVPPNEASYVWCEPFCFELPTNARNGVASDCVSISVKLINANSQGACYWHQAEIQPNLLDNPGLETGAAADPFVSDGWSNTGMDAGDTVAETTVLHSGAASLEFNTVDAAGEYISQNWTATANSFYGLGGYVYRDAGTLGIATVNAPTQATLATGAALANNSSATWAHKASVVRATTTTPTFSLDSGADGSSGYFDDCYVVALTGVSLTATPASEANSAENSGKRVDGRDTLTQAHGGKLGAASGAVTFKVRPRHLPADLVKYGNTTVYWMDVRQNANNRLRVFSSAANTVTIGYTANGAAEVTANWDATAAWTADQEMTWKVTYGSGGAKLLVGGVLKATAAGAVAFATAFSVNVYFGSAYDGTGQVDMVAV